MAHSVNVTVAKDGGAAVPVIAGKSYEDARKAQGDFFQAGELAEKARKEHRNHQPTVTEWSTFVVRMEIDGGSPATGGRHSALQAEFAAPKSNGEDAVHDSILRAFGEKHGK